MKTILVVDDERHIVDLVRLYLEKEGYAVVTAPDGEEALARHASRSVARSAVAATRRS